MVVIILFVHVLMSVEMGVKLKLLSCLTCLEPATFNHSADLSTQFLAVFFLLRDFINLEVKFYFCTFSLFFLDFSRLGGIPEDKSFTSINTNEAR